MGNNCSATVTVVKGHSRPDQIVPLEQHANGGNVNSISVGKDEEEDEEEEEEEDEEEEDICEGCLCEGCKCCKCFKKLFICLIPLLC
jgi:hypothetical protein